MQKNNSPHLAAGSKCPQLVKDKLRVYSMLYCPYAQRVLLVAAAKKIVLDVVNISTTERPEWIYEKYFSGKVPLIEFSGGQVLSESLLISDYLDEIGCTNRALHSGDHLQKAMDRLWISKFDSEVIPHVFKIFFQVDLTPEQAESTSRDLSLSLIQFVTELEKRGFKYFGGDSPGMLDYMLWPFIERIPVIQLIHSISVDIEMNPKWIEWVKNMKDDADVKSTFFPKETHFIYLKSRRDGKVLYDF